MKKKLTVWVEEEEYEVWKQAAWLRKTTLSDWVRKVLTATAQATKEGR